MPLYHVGPGGLVLVKGYRVWPGYPSTYGTTASSLEAIKVPGEATGGGTVPPTSGTYAPTRVFDFQTGNLSQWARVHGGSPTVTDEKPHPKWPLSCRFHVNDGVRASWDSGEQVRCEVTQDGTGNATGNITRNTDQWYGWSTWWPNDLTSPASWLIPVQWHHTGNTGQPPLAIRVTPKLTTPRLQVTTAGADYDLGQIAKGQWTDYVMRSLFHDDPGIARLTFKVNGTTVVNNQPVSTLLPDGKGGVQGLYLKMGLYGNRWQNQYNGNSIPEEPLTVWHTGMRYGPTEASITK